jgi:hypothetical protein
MFACDWGFRDVEELVGLQKQGSTSEWRSTSSLGMIWRISST